MVSSKTHTPFPALLPFPTPPSPLKCLGRHDKYHNQATHNERASDGGDQHDGATAGGEFAADDVVLGFEVAVEANEEDNDGNGDKGGPQRFADVAQLLVLAAVVVSG